MPLLAQAADLGWPAALVAIATMLLPLAWAIFNLVKARDERAAKEAAEAERDAAFVGIERGADPKTKMETRQAAKAAGLPEKDFAEKVKRATGKLAPLLLGALLLGLVGCCTVDHEAIAIRAEHRAAVCDRVAKRPDDRLPPAFAREFAREEAAAHRLTADRLREKDDTSARARIEGPQ